MSDNMPDDEMQICRLLNEWADATRTGRLDDILSGYRKDAVIYDVLAPMQYLGTEAYRRSWGDWQPETRAEGLFALEDLRVEAGSNAAFVFGFLRCGGTMPDGQTFEDLVRATFCLTKREGNWQIAHQHISKPIEIPKKVDHCQPECLFSLLQNSSGSFPPDHFKTGIGSGTLMQLLAPQLDCALPNSAVRSHS